MCTLTGVPLSALSPAPLHCVCTFSFRECGLGSPLSHTLILELTGRVTLYLSVRPELLISWEGSGLAKGCQTHPMKLASFRRCLPIVCASAIFHNQLSCSPHGSTFCMSFISICLRSPACHPPVTLDHFSSIIPHLPCFNLVPAVSHRGPIQ